MMAMEKVDYVAYEPMMLEMSKARARADARTTGGRTNRLSQGNL